MTVFRYVRKAVFLRSLKKNGDEESVDFDNYDAGDCLMYRP